MTYVKFSDLLGKTLVSVDKTENIGLVESQIKYLYNITCFKNNGEIYSSEDYITFDNLNLDIPVNLLNKRLIKS